MLTSSDGLAGSPAAWICCSARAPPRRGILPSTELTRATCGPTRLRRHVSLAREVEIFSGTVLENVHLERPEVFPPAGCVEALEEVGLLDARAAVTRRAGNQPHSGGLPADDQPGTPADGGPGDCGAATAAADRRACWTALPDAQADRLIRLLVDEDQPWTLAAGDRPRQSGGVRHADSLAAPDEAGREEAGECRCRLSECIIRSLVAGRAGGTMLVPLAYSESVVPSLRLARSLPSRAADRPGSCLWD